ncbi:E3 ubiquitin ligase BIG BROTHER-like [Iris pallida]|uniref:E3 ubiquitin ligase BIG BROTHER-like n=1 Tax=Iris pallida TaxID=29817 RepID=A0AAX6FV15_IRIPA|nr:E3 ubiquitin ligase BIG BROTHER-like [Iris pallida]
MKVELETKDKQQVKVHYVNTPVHCVVEEKFGEHSHDNDLELQETLYESLQRSAHIDLAISSTSTNLTPNQNRDLSRGEANSSETMIIDLQLAMDEALAKELQEVENQLAGTSIMQMARTEAGTSRESSTENRVPNPANTSVQVTRQDDIDPDNMTYEQAAKGADIIFWIEEHKISANFPCFRLTVAEAFIFHIQSQELQTLSEAIGAESRGLTDELISFLPSSTYKIGIFSRRDKHEECVICYMTYKNRDKLITLPCRHQYHKSCVTRWLKINKACPICNDDVFGS